MRKARVDVLVFEGVEEPDFIGPLEVLGKVDDVLGREVVKIRLLSSKSTARCAHGFLVTGLKTLGSAGGVGEVLIVPGGPGVLGVLAPNPSSAGGGSGERAPPKR